MDQVREGAVGAAAPYRLDRDTLKPFIEPLFAGLFGALKQADSSENEYIVKGMSLLN